MHDYSLKRLLFTCIYLGEKKTEIFLKQFSCSFKSFFHKKLYARIFWSISSINFILKNILKHRNIFKHKFEHLKKTKKGKKNSSEK